MGPEVAAAAEAAAPEVAASSFLTPGVSAALMAGGTAAQMLAAQQRARQQKAILNRAMDAADKTAASGNTAVIDSAQNQQGGAAQLAAVQQAQDAAAARTMADLKGAGADLIDTAAGDGNQSQAFLTAKADRALSEGNRLTAIAREVAKARAPGIVQGDNALARASLAEQLAAAGASSRGRVRAAQMDADSVDEPLYGSLGKIASMVGTIGMMNPAAAAPAAAGTDFSLGSAALGDAGEAGSNALGAAKFGDMAANGVKLGRTAAMAAPAAGGLSSALARALPQLGMFAAARRGAWMGR